MSRGRRIVWGLGVVALAWLLWRVTQKAPVQDLRLTQLTFDTGLTGWPAISADGKTLAYASDREGAKNLDLYVQQMPGGIPARLTDTPDDESEPAISADGKSIAYRSTKDGGGIYTIPVSGGAAKLLVAGARTPRYSPDGRSIAFQTDGGVFVIPAAGGTRRQLYPQMAARGALAWSPDGTWMMFAAGAGIWVAPRDGGAPQSTGIPERLAEAGLANTLPTDANWTADGLIFSARSGFARDLYRCPLDRHGKAAGAVVRLTTGTEWIGDAVASRVGRVAFACGRQRFDIWGVPVEGNSGKVPGPPYRITDSLAPTASPFLSGDGSQLLFNSSRHGFAEVWLKQLASGTERVAATGPTGATGGRFLRKSGRISFVRSDGLYLLEPATGKSQKLSGDSRFLWDTDRREESAIVTASDGGADALDLKTGQRTPLLRAPERVAVSELSYSPEDRWVVFVTPNGTAANRIYVVRPTHSGQIPFESWIAVTDGSAKVDKPRFSPDGRLIYFTLDHAGARSVEAVRFDPESGRTVGSPFLVFDGGTPRLSLGEVNINALSLGVAGDKLTVILGESSFNIWIADPVPRT